MKVKEKYMKFLEKKVKDYNRKKYYSVKVPKKDYVAFLKEVETALSDMIQQVPEPSKFLKRISKETDKWLNEMDEVNATSFKAGVCYGVWALSKLQKLRKETPVYCS